MLSVSLKLQDYIKKQSGSDSGPGKFLVVMSGGTTGILWVKARDAAEHPTCTG